jgi:hypothetical protein
MQCDLCDSPADGSLLCATCSEAIQRLLAIQRDAIGTASTSSDYVQSNAQETTRGAGVRDT